MTNTGLNNLTAAKRATIHCWLFASFKKQIHIFSIQSQR